MKTLFQLVAMDRKKGRWSDFSHKKGRVDNVAGFFLFFKAGGYWCTCVFCLSTPFLSVFFVSQEETTLIASNQQINDFYKSMWKINFTSQHCGK